MDGRGFGGAYVRLKAGGVASFLIVSPTERQAFPHIGGHSPKNEKRIDGKASLSAMPSGQAGSVPEIRRRFCQLPLALASGKVPQKSSGL